MGIVSHVEAAAGKEGGKVEGGTDKGQLTVGWDGEKEAGQGGMPWELLGNGKWK